jgi:DNA-binding SARP family transcriptional activator
VPLRRAKQRALLAFLALHAGEVVSTDRLVDALWGERAPPTATTSLQNNISGLRRLLGGAAIVTQPSGYVLGAPQERTDVGQFERLAADARATRDNVERAQKLRAALELWRGRPLEGREFEFFAQVELPPLALDRLIAFQDLVDAELALGRHAELIGEIESLIEEHPFDERLRAQLARALYRAGRQSDALDSLRLTRRLFRDELGLEPGPTLRELEQAILVHDPALSAPPRALSVQPGRKIVTVVSAGLGEHGRRAAAETPDPEALNALYDRLAGEMSAVAERHGGTVSRIAGGGVMAVFGVPLVHEDDARRALRTAVELREADASMREGPPALHIGVESGEVFAHETAAAELSVTGAPVTAARRLEQLAAAGQILLGPATLRLVRDAVEVAPLSAASRGAHPHPVAFRLNALVEPAPTIDRPPSTRIVDRDAELRTLVDAFETTRRERRCRVITVVGDAGIGKTRLASELVDRILPVATVLVGRCASYGEGATYLPLAEMLAQSGGNLAAVLGNAGSTGEELLALRLYFESLARARPLVLVLEDIHWAEPTLLDLVEHLRSHVVDAPLLVLCLARPELLEARPSWEALPLAPLDQEQTLELLDAVGSADVEIRSLHTRIAEIAEGNPLYAEQLLAEVTEGGTLGSVPPALDVLLQSRLDRLPAAERRLLQRAAVIGREFSLGAIVALTAQPSAAAIEGELAELTRRELVRGSSTRGFRFHHVLIRDVAYSGLPKAERAELHERLADWLVDGGDEIVGYHLEQAYRCRAELGLLDAAARRLAEQGGTLLGTAGIQARERGDTPAAVSLLTRAAGLLPESDSFRIEVLCELGIALRGAGRLEEATDTLSAAVEIAELTGDRRSELRARLELANVRMFSDPGGRSEELVAAAREAIPVFEAAGDDRSLARAWRLIAYVEGAVRCRFAASIEAAERALAHCIRGGSSTAACLGDLAAALYYGPTPAVAASRRCRSLVESADLAGEANVLVFLGGLEAMRGRFRDARRLVDRAETLYNDLGETALAHGNGGTVRGQIELLADDPVAAEDALRTSYEALASMGDRAYVATRAAELAEAVYRNGRLDEAWRLTETSEITGGADDVPTQLLWRTVRAKLLVCDGRGAEAEALAREAVALAEATDALSLRGTVLLDLADVLARSGRSAEAAATAAQALDLFVRKGNSAAAGRARATAGA